MVLTLLALGVAFLLAVTVVRILLGSPLFLLFVFRLFLSFSVSGSIKL